MSKKLNDLIRRKREHGDKLLSIFVTAGFPTLTATKEIILALDEAGVDFIELGMPFSDPLADGPVIQAASDKAIKNGADLSYVLEVVRSVRRHSSIPVILMGYLNPVYQMGLESFIASAGQAGADGLIIPDWVPEESQACRKQLAAAGLDLIQLVAPNTPDERIVSLAGLSSSFIYCLAYTGVTGQSGRSRSAGPFLRRVRRLTPLPLMVGFGVRSARDFLNYTRFADGVIIGSAFIRMLAATPQARIPAATRDFIRGIRP